MRIWLTIYASLFDIPRADVDVAYFLTKTPFRSVCKMVCCIYFPAYAALDEPSKKTMHCRACNGGIRVLVGVLAGVLPGPLAGLLGWLPGVLAAGISLPGAPPGVLAAKT